MQPIEATLGNPFALMMNPEAVFEAIGRSERLGLLQSRICRPLDNPRPEASASDTDATDATFLGDGAEIEGFGE